MDYENIVKQQSIPRLLFGTEPGSLPVYEFAPGEDEYASINESGQVFMLDVKPNNNKILLPLFGLGVSSRYDHRMSKTIPRIKLMTAEKMCRDVAEKENKLFLGMLNLKRTDRFFSDDDETVIATDKIAIVHPSMMASKKFDFMGDVFTTTNCYSNTVFLLEKNVGIFCSRQCDLVEGTDEYSMLASLTYYETIEMCCNLSNVIRITTNISVPEKLKNNKLRFVANR